MLCGVDTTKTLAPKKVVSSSGKLVRIVPQGLSTFTYDEELFALKCVWYLNTVWGSANFRNEVLTTYMAHRNGISHEEIYYIAMSGVSAFDTIQDEALKIFVALYDGGKKGGTLGYTVMQTGKIYTSKLYFRKCMVNDEPYNVAGHWGHEIMHTKGFKDLWPQKRKSVPYVYGRKTREIGLRLYNGNQLIAYKGLAK